MDRLEKDLAFFNDALAKTRNREERKRIQEQIIIIKRALLRRLQEERRAIEEGNRNMREALAILKRKKALENMKKK